MTNINLISSNSQWSSHQKNITMHQNSPRIYHSRPQKVISLFKFKNDGMPLFIPSSNIYQQTRSIRHTNHSEQNITTSLNLSPQQTHILNFPHKNKNIKHYQEHSKLILLKTPTSPHKITKITCKNHYIYE